MKKSFLLVTKIFVATVAGISLTGLLTNQPSMAQINDPRNPFSNMNSDQNTDPFSSNSNNFNPFDLIHRANFGTYNWNSQQQNQQLDSAAAAFKARQQKLLRGQQQANPVSPVITSPTTTPSNTIPSNN